MAPPPEYDKEPKAPDKSVTSNSVEDSKIVYNHIKDQSANTEHKTTSAVGNADVENNKHVETLDDGQLRALLDEAITYKCPKDREGKSSLFKELLEEVEQDEQACEAAARLGAGRNARRARARRDHHSSLQDLVAAMAGEAAPRRGRAHAHHAPAPPAGTVSARALHGGSLPSGVDTSFLLGEEAGAPRGGYLATVRCVNPPPLAERRVSTGDASPPPPPPPQPAPDPLPHDALARRSKPTFPMTYTARATLEIGSGSVCSGRAVTTTTASNQVRTASPDPRTATPAQPPAASGQARLLSALSRAGGGAPRGPTDAVWRDTLDAWYEGLDRYCRPATTSNQNVCRVTAVNTNLSLRSQKVTPALTTGVTSRDDIVVSSMEIMRNRNKMNVDEDKILWSKHKSTDKLECDNTNDTGDTYNDNESDISLKRQYRERVGNYLVAPSKITESPRNFRSLTIGKPLYTNNEKYKDNIKNTTMHKNTKNEKNKKKLTKMNEVNPSFVLNKTPVCGNEKEKKMSSNVDKSSSLSEIAENHISSNVEIIKKSDTVETSKIKTDFELVDIPFNSKAIDDSNSFTEYVAHQKKLIKELEINNNEASCCTSTNIDNKSFSPSTEEVVCEIMYEKLDEQMNIETSETPEISTEVTALSKYDDNSNSNGTIRSVVAKLPSNAYVLLTYSKSLLTKPYTKNEPSFKIEEIFSDANSTDAAVDCNKNNKPTKKNKKKSKQPQASVSAKNEGMNKKALKMLLYSDSQEKTDCTTKKLSHFKDKKVDSAIPFSCITTPEVVASCNTTPSAAQAAVAAEPKPLQPPASCRAAPARAHAAAARPPSPPPPTPTPTPATPATPATLAHSDPDPDRDHDHQPRGAASSSFNGLPLSRPAAAAATDEYKKSLDENGNAVQGFGSPLAGSGQHKKPRRKKSSKNETVIKSHQIDGYQGNKDIDEVLRFIESNAEGARAPKLRAKHKDDDDKGKKRSAERRKDKGAAPQRAASLEELSRTTLAELTDEPRSPARAKPERRSWGDDARAPLEPDALPPPELADFQTVTKKRKPRRRADERDERQRLQRRRGLRAAAAPAPAAAARRRLVRGHRAHAPQHPRPDRVVQLLRGGRGGARARRRAARRRRRRRRPVPAAAPRVAAAQGAARARRGGGPAAGRGAAGGGRGRRPGRRHVRVRRERAAAGRALRPAGARRGRARGLRGAALRAAAARARRRRPRAPARRLRRHSMGGRDARRRQGALLHRVRGARQLVATDEADGRFRSYVSCGVSVRILYT